MPAKERPTIDTYPYATAITTRWMDNDIYGHINNVTFYSFFDTAANKFLIDRGGLDIANDPVIALVVESNCSYHAPLAYPANIRAGVRVAHLGNRAVTYDIAIFSDRDPAAAANGKFVHVFVDRATRQPTMIPAAIRKALQTLQ
ncbi:MAG TPA: thioesterase family protein [Kofleriaceae bacterium]|nr:thioesterase family protein [Kofleriaceae bacterium]